MRPEILFPTDIVEAGDAIARFLEDVERRDFLDDELRQSAVMHKLIIIGEAAGRLSGEFVIRHSRVEWRDIISFRNFAVHDYFGVNWDTVWATATQDVPSLRSYVAEILRQIEADASQPGFERPA